MNRNYLKAIPREWRTISRAFTALGDEHRQRILLTFEKGERLNVGQIVEVSTLSRSAVSHHLKLLRESGVLQSEKQGKEVYYWIDRALLEQRRFGPLFWTQFLGAANDSLFKFAFTLLATYHAADWGGLDPGTAGFVIGGIFIAPFLLFSATAGQLADQLDKAWIMRRVK